MSANKQRGASLPEFALTLSLFLLVVFGIMELALTYFVWNRVSEAARDGARLLIVNAPVGDLSAQSCAAASPPVVTVACGSADGSAAGCAPLLSTLWATAPFITAANVSVQYRCAATGNPTAQDADRVRTVTLTVSNVAHPQVITALAGLGWRSGGLLPAVSVTRTSEDLYTKGP